MTAPAPAPELRVVRGGKDDGAQMPPHDPEAETSVLSAVMLDPTALPKVIDFLRPEHFYSDGHRWIYAAAVGVWRAKDPVDLTTVASWLRDRDKLLRVGGAAYIAQVADASPVVANVRAHAVAVHNAWRRRQVILACQKIAAVGYIDVPDVQAWTESATKTLGTIALKNPARPVETNEQALDRILAGASAAEGDGGPKIGLSGFPTGLHGVDRILGGLAKGSKTTIAASTGGGKSAFGAQMSIEISKQGVGVLYFSTEMKRQELLLRALANEAQVDGVKIRRRELAPHQKLAIVEASKRIKRLPWRIDETPRLTIEDIAIVARGVAERFLVEERVPLGMIVLDHIHRLDPSKSVAHRDKHEQFAHATKSFKILCQELDVVGLELAQAKAQMPGKKRVKPRAENGIAETSQIAKESDDVVFLWAEDDPVGDPRQSVKAIIAKQRAGAKGEVDLMFRRDLYRFTDPNTPNPSGSNPSRQYVDTGPDSGADTLTRGL